MYHHLEAVTLCGPISIYSTTAGEGLYHQLSKSIRSEVHNGIVPVILKRYAINDLEEEKYKYQIPHTDKSGCG